MSHPLPPMPAELLDAEGIAYQIRRHSRPVYTAEEAAAERGVLPGQVLKTMIVKGASGRVAVALLPGDKRLDSARLAEVLGEPVKLLGRREVKKRYGLTIGAISPLQIQDQTCFYADTALKAHEQLAMSSGAPDSGIVLARADLERLLTIRWLAIGETA